MQIMFVMIYIISFDGKGNIFAKDFIEFILNNKQNTMNNKAISLKKYLCIVSFLAVGKFYSQVGINNTTPKATLDVTGQATNTTTIDGIIAPRITGEQLKSKDNVYNANQDGAIIYVTQPLAAGQTTARTVNVLDKGYFGFNSSLGTTGQWVSLFNRDPTVIAGGDILNRVMIAETTLSTAGTTQANLYSKQFTLTRKSMIDVFFSIPVSTVARANGQAPVDGTSKLFGLNVYLVKTDAPTFPNQNILRDTESFTNSGNFYANGIYQIGGSRKFVLEAGTYTMNFNAFVYANPNENVGVRATFGTNGNGASDLRSVIDIIATPMDK
ncbi:Uncharacterised protein [Chryseobacterium nakagawai]|nr:Uncharacterised protein [Chryseobacterium nakagawai]